MAFNINDVVRLALDLPAQGLTTSLLGVVVAKFSDPVEAYEVEFTDEHGQTIAQLALLPHQIVSA